MKKARMILNSLFLLLSWAPAIILAQQNDSIPTVVIQTSSSSSSSGAVGNCICQGRGELRDDYVLDWLNPSDVPSLSLDGIVPSSSDTSTVYSCGDLQDFLKDRSTCPEAEWLSFCCTEVPPFYQCAQQVRAQVLRNGYDKIAIPSASLVHDPVNVTVQMKYHSVTGINEAEGIIDIFVYLILKWKDTRLAWDYNASSDAACTALPVNFRAEMQQGLKDSEIWVPEFDLYNQITGVAKGLTGNLATVQNDGSVTWFRQGNLKAMCQMENLGQIPFEDLGCQLLMGSTNLGVNYKLDPNGGLLVSNYAGPYNGYRLVDWEPGHNEKEDVIFFNFKYERGTRFYVSNIILPVTIFSYCSILTVLVGTGAFQTLALNFTLLLTSTTQKISTARLLPVTNRSMWLVDYVSGSFYFIVLTLVESFVKFIILKMREERQQDEKSQQDDEEGNSNGEERTKESSEGWSLPPWFFTFSLRKLDVIWGCVSLFMYTLYIIIFFTTTDNWGAEVSYFRVYNQSNSEL